MKSYVHFAIEMVHKKYNDTTLKVHISMLYILQPKRPTNSGLADLLKSFLRVNGTDRLYDIRHVGLSGLRTTFPTVHEIDIVGVMGCRCRSYELSVYWQVTGSFYPVVRFFIRADILHVKWRKGEMKCTNGETYPVSRLLHRWEPNFDNTNIIPGRHDTPWNMIYVCGMLFYQGTNMCDMDARLLFPLHWGPR